MAWTEQCSSVEVHQSHPTSTAASYKAAFSLDFSVLCCWKIMAHDTETLPVITIDDGERDVVCQFTHVGSAKDRILNVQLHEPHENHPSYPGQIMTRTTLSNADSMFCASLPVCTRCSDNADCDGWVMTTVWRVVTHKRQSGTQKECSNTSRPETTHGRDFCDKICHSRTRLFSQNHPLLQPNKQLATS